MKEITFKLPDELANKFELAMQLTGANRDALGEEFVRSYLARALQSAADEFRVPEAPKPNPTPVQPQQTAASRTAQPQTPPPTRADSAAQAQNQSAQGRQRTTRIECNVTLDALRRRCSDPTGHPNTYVPHFDNNYSQMKFDNGNSHGKVFEEHDGYITIWDRISDTLQKYRDFFE